MENNITLELKRFYLTNLNEGKTYHFAKLPFDDQILLIQEYQNGNYTILNKIVLGFWNYICHYYIYMIGSLKNHEVEYSMIFEDIQDLILKIHDLILKNDLKRSLSLQVFTNLKFVMMNQTNFHLSGSMKKYVKPEDPNPRERKSYQLKLSKKYIKKIYTSIDRVDENKYLLDHSFENTIELKHLLDIQRQIKDFIKIHFPVKLDQQIILMYMSGIINSEKYLSQYIISMIGSNKTHINKTIHKFHRLTKRHFSA
jgi:hypothetical protein